MRAGRGLSLSMWSAHRFAPQSPFRTFPVHSPYMARIDLRLSEQDKRRLLGEASARGVSLTALILERALGSAGSSSGLDDVVEDHERRLARLEGMAGL